MSVRTARHCKQWDAENQEKVATNYRRERLRSREGLKWGVRPAVTCMGRPVRGFFPRRGRRRGAEKVPNPTRVTNCPLRSAPRIEARSARRARSAATLVHPPAAAMDATISARVTLR